MAPNVRRNGREKYARVRTRPTVVETTDRVTNPTALLYIGLGTVPRHEAIEIPSPTAPPSASITIIGQMDAPPSSGTVQNKGVPNTKTDALNIAIPNAATSEMRTDLRNLRPITT
jgi:hypothetical protein